MWIDDLPDRDRVRVTFRYLDQMMVVFFGEDWFEDYESDEQAAIDDFVRRTKEPHRRGTLAELDSMMAVTESPEAFERDFAYLSWAYRPGRGPTAYRDFADRIATAIRASLD